MLRLRPHVDAGNPAAAGRVTVRLLKSAGLEPDEVDLLIDLAETACVAHADHVEEQARRVVRWARTLPWRSKTLWTWISSAPSVSTGSRRRTITCGMDRHGLGLTGSCGISGTVQSTRLGKAHTGAGRATIGVFPASLEFEFCFRADAKMRGLILADNVAHLAPDLEAEGKGSLRIE